MKILSALCMLLVVDYAFAVSLNGRTNDDSVCDLAPYTTSRLSQLTFVDGNSSNLAEIYERIALRWITASCQDRQQLILHSDIGLRMEEIYFRNVATKLCGSGSIKREPYSTAESTHGFQVRCTINKLQQAQLWLKQAESERSTENLIASSNPTNASTPASGDTKVSPKPCKKGITYGALIGISGGCRD
jgi:hypothetical protein